MQTVTKHTHEKGQSRRNLQISVMLSGRLK